MSTGYSKRCISESEEVVAAMKIQQVSAKTGLSIHTLRYYEQTGLVTPIARAPNGHRGYTDDDVYTASSS